MDGYKMRLERGIRHSADAAPRSADAAKDVAAVRNWINDEKNWESVKDMQENKQAAVDALRQWRKRFWSSGAEEGENRLDALASHTLHANSDGSFSARVDAREIALTKGEVLSASEWGLWWGFDDTVSLHVQREVMTHQVRRALAEIYDEQLTTFGTSDRLSDDSKRDTYARKQLEERSYETMPNGILAEKLLFSFLTKEMYDGDLPFQIESVDVYEDIEHKIDFIVAYQGAHRGVKVKEPEKHRLGIQFTIDPHARERKLEQLTRMHKHIHDTGVEDIVLITLPLSHVRDIFDAWRYGSDNSRIPDAKLDPRGPDHLWSSDIKKQIIDGLVRGVGVER